MTASADDVRRSVKLYLGVLFALAVLTCLTVYVAHWRFASLVGAIAIAMVIASVKGSLVASVFMHLMHEKRVIFVILALTFFFLIFLLLWPAMTSTNDMIHGVVPMEPVDKFANAHHGEGHADAAGHEAGMAPDGGHEDNAGDEH